MEDLYTLCLHIYVCVDTGVVNLRKLTLNLMGGFIVFSGLDFKKE